MTVSPHPHPMMAQLCAVRNNVVPAGETGGGRLHTRKPPNGCRAAAVSPASGLYNAHELKCVPQSSVHARRTRFAMFLLVAGVLVSCGFRRRFSRRGENLDSTVAPGGLP